MRQDRNISGTGTSDSPARPGPGGAGRSAGFSARSVIASILLPMRRPELPGSALVRCGALFGIAEGTCRVALSRMVAAGELEAEDGVYRLTGRLLTRQARQELGRHPKLEPWDGSWAVALVAVDRRAAPKRAALRAALRRLRMGELREGAWLRPANLPAWREQVAAELPDAGQCLWLRAAVSELAGNLQAAELAQRLWDLPGWAARADQLVGELGAMHPALEAGDTTALAPVFSVAAAVVRHLTADPLLPPELLPPAWPADRLRREYDAFEQAYQRVLRTWLAAELERH